MSFAYRGFWKTPRPLSNHFQQMAQTAEEFKKKGNDAFASGHHEEAIEHFTNAIQLDPSNAVLYSNRSAAEASAHLWQSALEDAEKAIELKPDWFKGYSRRGAALIGLGQPDKACTTYERALQLEPGNATLLQSLEIAKKQTSRTQTSDDRFNLFSDPAMIAKMAQDPKVSKYFADPEFVQKIAEIQRDPKAVTKHFNDQRILEVFGAMLSKEYNTEVKFGTEMPEEVKATQETKPKPEDAPKPTSSLTSEQELALVEKELGNAAYKQKDLVAAMKHYESALELDPTNTSILANKSAVLFEMGEFERCIAVCEETVCVGRETHAEFKLIGRVLGRMGSCYERLGDLDNAIKFYNKSLTEARNPEIHDKLKSAEKAKFQQDKFKYYDPALAEQERNLGNAAFKNADYVTAVKHYTEAIKRDEQDPRAYSNRAACYLKLAAIPEGMKDAEKCIELDPSFVKGYLRKAALQFAKREYEAAIATCEVGMEHDKDGKHRSEFQAQISRCYSQTSSSSAGNDQNLSDEERAKRALQNPEVQEILADPAMRLILQQMQDNPQALMEHMKNPGVAQKIKKLAQSGILRTQ